MAIYPGATYVPNSWGGKVARNKQGRGILHVAVSGARSLPPWSGNTWHFYVAKAAPNGATDGSGGPAYCEQYKDTEFRAYGDVDANDDAIVVETAGGLGSSKELNAEPWTRAQELRLADLMRWESQQPNGAPLDLLPDSRAGRTGWGPHRLGIKHSAGPRAGWWQPGGEVWSSSLGKECPGDAKVAQVPGIIQLAREGGDDLMAAREDILNWLQNITGADLRLIVAKVDALTAMQQQELAGGGIDVEAIVARVSEGVTASVTAQLLASVGDVVRTELGDDNSDQAEKIVAGIAARLAA